VLKHRMSNEHANFDRLVTQYGATLYRYVARHLYDRSVCEDVVNETFTVAWRHRSQIPELNQELAWLYAIAFRVLSNQRRSRDREIAYLKSWRSRETSHPRPMILI
jgi:DNA-directed RNA polymerase specialized sigma24 family protein